MAVWDNMLNAAAAAWSARRIAAGTARSLLHPPKCDLQDRAIAI
jgi:hypothetical protein